MIIHKTYQLRAYCSKSGYVHIDNAMSECATLYNAALEERINAYKTHGITITRYQQQHQFALLRHEDPFWGNVSQQIGRGVLRRIDRAMQSFFRRVKDGQTPGFPRFKSGKRWRTIEIANPSRAMVKKARDKYHLCIKGLPRIEMRSKRELPSPEHVVGITLVRRCRRLVVNLTYEIDTDVKPAMKQASMLADWDMTRQKPFVAIPAVANSKGDAPVGIDMGVTDRMTLSCGEVVNRRVADREDIANKQRRLARCRKGSRQWHKRAMILANAHGKARLRNRNECHRITTDIVRNHGFIAVEDLPIGNMTRSAKGTVEEPGRNVKAKSGLNREILTQSWGVMRQQLAYKAEWAGVPMVAVDPRGTSQRCSGCGHVSADSRLRHDRKWYMCVACGVLLDADVNAARNIMALGLRKYDEEHAAGKPSGSLNPVKCSGNVRESEFAYS